MHVVGQVWGDEIVTANLARGQIPGEIGIGPEMVGGVIVIGGDIIEKGERVVPGSVWPAACRAGGTRGHAFHIAAPLNAGIVQKSSQMVGAGNTIKGRPAIAEKTKVGARLQENVIGFAGMLMIVGIVLLAIGRLRQKAIDIRSVRAVLDR